MLQLLYNLDDELHTANLANGTQLLRVEKQIQTPYVAKEIMQQAY